MKYLLLLVVVMVGFWMVSSRSRKPPEVGPRSGARRPGAPQAMLRCAHCGLHLPAADAVGEGEAAYCTEAHRRLGPGPVDR